MASRENPNQFSLIPTPEETPTSQYETMSIEDLRGHYFTQFKVMIRFVEANNREYLIHALLHPEEEEAELVRIHQEELEENEQDRLRDSRAG